MVAQHCNVKPGREADEEMPCSNAHFNQRQTTEVEPDLEPTPCMQQLSQSKATRVPETLGTPLLQDTAPGKQSLAPSNQKTKICFRALAVLLLWGIAALLGLSVASTAQAKRTMHATVARPQTRLDFTLRLASSAHKCLGVANVKVQSQVVLQDCSALGGKQFLLLNDGTIRSRSNDQLCMTSVSENKLVLSTCVQSEMQVFDVQPSGMFALKAKPSECISLLHGDIAAGVVGLNHCSANLNEVFVYGGGFFLVPELEHELSKVRSLPPVTTDTDQMQENLKAVCLFAVGMFVLSALLIMAACPKRLYQCLSVLVLGFIAGVIFLICSSLLSAAPAMQESERLTQSAKVVASGQTADLDFTLRMIKSADRCLGVGSLKDNSKVSLQQCKASTVQQFILQDDGTIRAKQADELCMTVEQESKTFVLSPCDASKSHLQTFSKQAESRGWLQLHATPWMCLNLWGGDEDAGTVGLYQCGRDLNEVFVYSGGNVAISGLALQVHKVRLLLKQASRPLEGGFFRILTLGGGACFLLLAVPSVMLLTGSLGPRSA